MEADWRALLNDNKNFDQNEPYSIKSIVEKLDKVTDLEHFNPYYILSPIYELTKVFGKISAGLARGFQDITSKAQKMRRMCKLYPEIDNIQDIILKEMSLGIHQLNGNNNDKYGHGNDQYKDYSSAARTFLRLLWFMEYIIRIDRKLVTEDSKTLKEILKEAYEEVLAPRHPWLVRKAVGIALTFAGCSKKEAVGYMFEVSDLNAESKKKITMVADKLENLWKAGNQFYKEHGLLGLE